MLLLEISRPTHCIVEVNLGTIFIQGALLITALMKLLNAAKLWVMHLHICICMSICLGT